MKLVIGLGNPGRKYRKTRHNIAWRVLDAMDLDFSMEKKFKAEIVKNDLVIFCKPQTFMNNSGQAVRAVADYYKIDTSDIIVIHDDKDLQFEDVRIEKNRSSAGHNGVQSIINHLGTQNFTRMRIGVMNDHPLPDTASFVLQKFSREEEKKLKQTMLKLTEQVNSLLT